MFLAICLLQIRLDLMNSLRDDIPLYFSIKYFVNILFLEVSLILTHLLIYLSLYKQKDHIYKCLLFVFYKYRLR